MVKDKSAFNILVIEDNPGDFLLVEDYLSDQILHPKIVNATSFSQASSILTNKENIFDVILLDLTLPDRSGNELITDIFKIASSCPIIILTGYMDIDFSIQSITLGVSDYILKDDLSGFSLYKSIIYSIERRNRTLQLKESEKRYSDLFHLNPQPMWVYALDSRRFLDVNAAAINHYGYSREEFLTMTIEDVSAKKELRGVQDSYTDYSSSTSNTPYGSFTHLKKNGEIIQVELRGYVMSFKDEEAEIVIANDVTEKSKFITAIQSQNQKLRDIAWMQSHLVRAPLARMMGLIDLIKNHSKAGAEKDALLNHLLTSADELDNLIRDISEKTSKVKLK